MPKSQISWGKSVFFRLILTFLCILIPIYILGIGIYQWAVDTIRTDISNSMISQCINFIGDFGKDIERIQMLQNSSLVDDDLNDLVNKASIMSTYQKQAAMQRLQNRLITIQSSNKLIKNVRLHIPPINKTIEATGSIDELDKDDFEYFGGISLIPGNQIIYKDGDIHLIAAASFLDTNNKPYVSHLIDISISSTELKNALENLETYESENSILLDPLADFAVLTDSPDEIIQQFNTMIKNDGQQDRKGVESIDIKGKRYLTAYTSSEYLKMTYLKYVAEEEIMGTLKQFQVWFWMFTATAFIIIFLYSASTYKFIKQPLTRLVKSFYRAENGDLGFEIDYKHDDEFGYLYRGFNKMIKKIEQMITQVYTQKLLAQKAELKQLQAQVNPHFLYNSFFILHRIIMGENIEKAAAFSEQLGNYFKFVTRNTSDEVSLDKEAEHARIYTDIQAMRFSRRLRIEFAQLPEKYADLKVPRLILQPVLENALEHGLKEKERNGLLRITFHEEEAFFVIVIEDNGDELSSHEIGSLQEKLLNAENSEEITGIINIHRRIQLKFGGKSGLSVMRGELGGLKVIITLEAQRKE